MQFFQGSFGVLLPSGKRTTPHQNAPPPPPPEQVFQLPFAPAPPAACIARAMTLGATPPTNLEEG